MTAPLGSSRPGPSGEAAPPAGPTVPSVTRSTLPTARLWAAAHFPYLASGLFGCRFCEAPGIGTLAVDERWRLWVDPTVIDGWSPAQLGSVLVHHVCHLLRTHAERALAIGIGPAEATSWVRCADAEINDDMVPAGLDLPGDPVLPQHLGAGPGRLAEQYYEAAKRSGRDRGPKGVEDDPTGWSLDCGSGADGQRRPWERPGSAGGGEDDRNGPHLSPWEADLLRRQVASECMRHHKEAGNVPAGLLRWASEVLEPRVDWRRVLAAELRRAVVDTVGAVDYSYRRPSRRSSVAGVVVLPALRRPVPEVAVVCDTSGSMSDDLLARSLAEVEGLLRSLGLARQVRVLACDAAAGPARRVSSSRQVELVGGGGTDMGAGIEAAARLRPRPGVVVVLTDGFTPWPAAAPPGTRVVVGLLGERAPSAPEWARAVRVPDVG